MTAVGRLKDNLKAKVAEDHSKGETFRCTRPFCGRPSMRGEGTGFGFYLCRYHTARLAKHGHPEIPTIKGPDLRPYVETAKRYIKAELAAGNVRVQLALAAIWGIMQTSGAVPNAMDIKQWSPKDKAKAAFARLREAGITADSVMASHMGVAAYLADDTWAPRSEEYRVVQSAKALHRRASGSHVRYDVPVAQKTVGRNGTVLEYDGSTATVELHVYPRSQGQVLRVIGKAIDEACGAIAEEQAQAVIAAKTARYGRHPCHTTGYEPEWRKQNRAKHAAALKQRQQAEEEAKRQETIREILATAASATITWQR